MDYNAKQICTDNSLTMYGQMCKDCNITETDGVSQGLVAFKCLWKEVANPFSSKTSGACNYNYLIGILS